MWLAIRNGKVTSSTFGEIVKHRQTTDSQWLVKDIMAYNGLMKKVPPQICWGKDILLIMHIMYRFKVRWLLDIEWYDFVVFSNDTVVVDQIVAVIIGWIYWKSWNNFTYNMWYQNFYLVKYFRKNLEQMSRYYWILLTLSIDIHNLNAYC